MSADSDRPPAWPADSRELYRAQRRAQQGHSLAYLLLGLISAGRKAAHKAVAQCAASSGDIEDEAAPDEPNRDARSP